MLSSIIQTCPDELWQKDKQFFFMTFHVTIFLDYYLTIPVNTFKPPLTYTIGDWNQLPPEAIDDVLPDEFYSKEQLIAYLSAIRAKCKKLIHNTPVEGFTERWIAGEDVEMHGLCPSLVINYSVLEILVYNLRHIQHHVAQLNLLLRQKANLAVDWISQSD
ncbi:hypothetical protein CK934_16795 [Chitinophaga sp. MD30]|nr:hypothetical protein CK934_16795 [Chitinophaga sp. MD30]